MALAASLAALAMVSCDKYEDGRPQKSVTKEFNKMYPDAFDVEWEWDGKYWEVSFETGSRLNGTEHEAWYDDGGDWLRTKTEIPLSAVPQKIINILAGDMTYGTASYADNDADYIETPSGNFYRFDLRLNGVVVEVDVNVNGEVALARQDF